MSIRTDAVLADTDVLSFQLNLDPVRKPAYDGILRGKTVFVSFVTVAEMRFGALRRRWGADRVAKLERFLSQYVIVESTPDIGIAWAQVRCDALAMGRPIERQDAWIAATALCLNAPLVTHNAAHFSHIPALHVITVPDSA